MPAHWRDERGEPAGGAGELLKLGIDVGQTTVAKYMARRRRPPNGGKMPMARTSLIGAVLS
jgi:hypothetical protein